MRCRLARAVWLLLAGAGLFPLACARTTPELATPRRLARGVVLVLPGIEGRSPWNRRLAEGLDEGGVTSAIQVYDWTTRVPGNYVGNLTDLPRNRREAFRLARWIEAYLDEHPGAPVYLVGHSGGGGMAVLTLEALAPGYAVAGVILLAPAVSPAYDLTPALRRVHTAVYNFHSEKDVSALRLGTSLFGSIDRTRGPAAGAVGFQLPPDASVDTRALYASRLRQVAWTPRLQKYGADGSHLGWTSRQFARDYLAPIIAEDEARWRVHTPDDARARHP